MTTRDQGSFLGTLLNGVVLIAGLALLMLEMSTLRNTLGATSLVLAGFAGGGLLFVLLAPLRRRAVVREQDRIAAAAFMLAACIAAATAAASHLNHRLGQALPTPEPLLVMGKEFHQRTSKSPAYWTLQLRYRARDKWIKVPQEAWEGITPGDAFPTPVLKGALGAIVLACPEPCR